MHSESEKIAILGSSRGLGLAIADEALKKLKAKLLLSSRKVESLKDNTFFLENSSSLQLLPLDFTKPLSLESLLSTFREFQPTRIFYCAGGGPYGYFSEKSWASHSWTLTLNLLFPAELLHTLLSERSIHFKKLQQIIFIGSAIAESNPDPRAASYASAKHGLKGLLHSIILENTAPDVDLRLYSPGYMDTPMLPPQAKPRLNGNFIASPQSVAQDFMQWALQKSCANSIIAR